jgi:hypothetical protein
LSFNASADLLALFNRLAARPAADAIQDTAKYLRLTESQNRVVADIAARTPHVLYGAPQALVTVDNKVFTFGTDANNLPVFPIGKVGIYPSLSAIPDYPWREGSDYLSEGTQIRIPNDRTWSSTLYWRGITNPGPIDGTHEPALYPEAARELIALDAVRGYASEGGRNPDVKADMERDYAIGFAKWMLVWRTQFRNGGALMPLVAGGVPLGASYSLAG